MNFEGKSLSIKLLVVVGTLFIIMSVVYMGVSVYSLNNTEKVIVN